MIIKKKHCGPTQHGENELVKALLIVLVPTVHDFTSPITGLGKPPVQICKLLSGCEDSFPSTTERERVRKRERGREGDRQTDRGKT